jgi:hypothetical protein
MKKSKIKKSDAIIIIIIFALYIIGYAWMIEPKKKSYKKDDMVTLQTMSSLPRGVEPKEPKPSPPQWPVELGKYFYWIDIDPGYEMEDEVFEVVGKTGDNLLVRKHNEWPDISGHFEWYCNERLTTTQQMYDYVVSHRKAILKQMKAVRERGISREFDEASYFQDHYDDYLDDPEDEIRFLPEIFEANED